MIFYYAKYFLYTINKGRLPVVTENRQYCIHFINVTNHYLDKSVCRKSSKENESKSTIKKEGNLQERDASRTHITERVQFCGLSETVLHFLFFFFRVENLDVA